MVLVQTKAEKRAIMTATMDRVYKDALELPLDQRLAVVHRILERSDTENGQEWDGIIRERIQQYDCGQAKTRSASDVFAALEKRLDD